MKLAQYLDDWIPRSELRRIGEVLVSSSAKDSDFFLCHISDKMKETSELTLLDSTEAIERMIENSESGEYRPLKTRRNMKNGWKIETDSIENLYEILDTIYPAALAETIRYHNGEINPISFRTTLSRQSGKAKSAKIISDNQANEVMRDVCGKGCLRKIAWPIDDICPVSRIEMHQTQIHLICTEACGFAVSKASEIARDSKS